MCAKSPKHTYDLIMVATGSRRSLLEALIHSVDAHAGDLKVMLLVIYQGSEAPPPVQHIHLQWENTSHSLPLSVARNWGLALIEQAGYRAQHLMFPDDDTVIPPAFFGVFSRRVKPGEAYLGRVLNAEDHKEYKPYPDRDISGQDYALLPFVASVALLLPHAVVKKTGFFDERLGAGAPWGSSEDLDYYLRCLAHATFHFCRDIYNLHPGRFTKYGQMKTNQIWRRFKAYSDGYYYVMFKHRQTGRLYKLPLRALGGALLSLLRGQFSLSLLYLRLFAYRLKLHGKMARQNPQFFQAS